MKNVKHFTQKYIDWVIRLGRFKFSLLGFIILSSFALCTQIILSLIVLGKIDWLTVSYSVIFGLISAPFVIYFFTVLVEKLELSRQDLAKSIQDKSTLLATISHELRTPLNGILGLSRILLDSNLTEQQRNYLNTISVSAVSLGNIFNDIIDLEKIDSRRIELYRARTDFHRFLADVQNIAQLMTAQKGLQFELKCGENLPQFLLLDSTRLSQVLWNLLSNAVKFTETGKISLNVERVDETQYLFEVQDTGQGIAPQELDKIFTLYYQVESDVQKPAGTGIGLAVSKNIAKLMNGDLRVSSQLGVGSTFHLNIEAAPAPESNESENLKTAVQNLRILLVEDIQLNVVVAQALLQKLGHQVDVAMSGRAAIEAFERKDYDLLLLDIQLPDMSGFEVANYLREGYLQDRYDYLPPLVALTANVMHNKAEYQAKGMDDVLRKPLSAKELIACLNEYFEQDEGQSAVDFASRIHVDQQLADYFDLEALQQLLSFISLPVYQQNFALFQQLAKSGAELDLIAAYQQYQQQQISAQQLAEVAHKLKGAAASLAMLQVQQLADKIQQWENADWQLQLVDWMAELESLLPQSLAMMNDWLEKANNQ